MSGKVPPKAGLHKIAKAIFKNKGKLVDEVPDGYEIYEHPPTDKFYCVRNCPGSLQILEKDQQQLGMAKNTKVCAEYYAAT